MEVCQSAVQALGPIIQRTAQVRPDTLEIKFQGWPFRAIGEGVVHAQMLVLTLLDSLEGEGYSLYASIDMEWSEAGSDTLICSRERGWVKRAPGYY